MDLNETPESYRSLLLSFIPATVSSGTSYSFPLWCRDINANATLQVGLVLMCPVERGSTQELSALEKSISIVPLTENTHEIRKLVRGVDVVELPGNLNRTQFRVAWKLLGIAQQEARLVTLGISSNRPKTMRMNAKDKPILSKMRAGMNSFLTTKRNNKLLHKCDAVRIVGQGLLPLVDGRSRNISVETASWIRLEEINSIRSTGQSRPKVVIASRLEPMKGVKSGILAADIAFQNCGSFDFRILGVGPQEANLRKMVANLSISTNTEFVGQLDYPDAFYGYLEQTEFVLLPNLNDEQPRLIFDAISRGAIPICPSNSACLNLNLDPRLYYELGDLNSMATVLSGLLQRDSDDLAKIRLRLTDLLVENTVDKMHERRNDWVKGLLRDRADGE